MVWVYACRQTVSCDHACCYQCGSRVQLLPCWFQFLQLHGVKFLFDHRYLHIAQHECEDQMPKQKYSRIGERTTPGWWRGGGGGNLQKMRAYLLYVPSLKKHMLARQTQLVLQEQTSHTLFQLTIDMPRHKQL